MKTKMKRNCLVVYWCIVAAIVSLCCENAWTGEVIISSGNSLKAYSNDTWDLLWSVDTTLSSGSVYVVPDGAQGVVLLSVAGQTGAYDATTGTYLWTTSGDTGGWCDVHRQMYTDLVRYPHGAPNLGASPAPDVILNQPGETSSSTTQLVDSRTGEVIWTRTDTSYPLTQAREFLPTGSGSYDVMFGTGPRFTGTGGGPFRVDGWTGSTVIWQQEFANRFGISVPDVTGDGQYDFFAEPSYWSSTVMMLDGATGDTVWSTSYGSFDVLQTPQLIEREDGGYDVIVSAQGASAGGVRRYRTEDGTVVWDSSHTYNNNTIVGLLRRTDGLTVLSGWRHQAKAVAIDAETDQVLWDDVPANNADLVGIGVPDMTGDGSDDFLALNNGWVRLYDGVTGIEQGWFAPIAADGVAYTYVPEPSTLALLTMGTLALLAYAWRRRRWRETQQ